MLPVKRIEGQCHRQPEKFQRWHHWETAFLTLIGGQKLRGRFLNGQRWSNRDVNSRRWREKLEKWMGWRWKIQRESEILNRWQRSWWTALETAAAQRLATLCREVRCSHADVAMSNKNVYSSLSSFHTLLSAFQTLFLSFSWRWQISDLPSTTELHRRPLGNIHISGWKEGGGEEWEMEGGWMYWRMADCPLMDAAPSQRRRLVWQQHLPRP